MSAAPRYRVGLVGARGHVGGELVRLLAGHPQLTLTRAAARQDLGRPLAGADAVVLEDMSPGTVAAWPVDVAILALPNGHAAAYAALAPPDTVVVDLSADHRFDPAWAYGLPERERQRQPERTRPRLHGARRIANPGCYATGIQLGLGPALARLAGSPVVFGVSGHSGAGTTPSPRNDPARLRDNLLAYSLTGHLHEREASHHLGHSLQFVPHVAAWFRGISLTLSLPLARPHTATDLLALYRDAYADEPLVQVRADIPEVQASAGRHDVQIGGFAVAGDHAVLVVTLDNLLKGAASQALQNINLALGLPERLGVPHDPPLSPAVG